MRACLVHHADAVGPDVDPQRPLSARGVRQADWVATAIRDAEFAPAVIWHSGKLRARQTAEAMLRGCNPFADFRMVRGLRPEDPPAWMRDELAAETREVLVVGHMPNIRLLFNALVGSAEDFPLHGAVLVERTESGAWTEQLRVQPAAET